MQFFSLCNDAEFIHMQWNNKHNQYLVADMYNLLRERKKENWDLQEIKPLSFTYNDEELFCIQRNYKYK